MQQRPAVKKFISAGSLFGLAALGSVLILTGCSGAQVAEAEPMTLEECVIGKWEVDFEKILAEQDPEVNHTLDGYARIEFTQDKILHEVDYTQSMLDDSNGEPWEYLAVFEGSSEQEYSIEDGVLIYGWDKTEGTVEVTTTSGDESPVVRQTLWSVPPYGLEAKIQCDADTLSVENVSYADVDKGEGFTVYKRS